MTNHIKPGERAHIVESAGRIREVKVTKVSGEFVNIQFPDSVGGIRIRKKQTVHL